MVLDRVVGTTWKLLCDGAPLVSEIFMGMQNDLVFLRGPVFPAESRVELIHPTLTCLLSCSSREMSCYHAPLLWAIPGDEIHEHAVFIDSPAASGGGLLGGGIGDGGVR